MLVSRKPIRILKRAVLSLFRIELTKIVCCQGIKITLEVIFLKYPQLIKKETSRRFDSEQVEQALKSSGFRLAKMVSHWETRRNYHDFEELNNDLLLRTGRSILHELTDVELRELISFIGEELDDHQAPIIEKDSWTVWFAIRE